MGKSSKKMKDRILVGILSFAMLLSGAVTPAGKQAAKAADVSIDLLNGSSITKTGTVKKDDYGTDLFCEETFENLGTELLNNGANGYSALKFEATVKVNSCSAGTPTIVLYAMDKNYEGRKDAGKEAVIGTEQTITLDLMSFASFSRVGIRFTQCGLGTNINYTISSAKITGTKSGGSSGGGASAGEDETTWDVENEDVKLSYRVTDKYNSYMEYYFTVANSGSQSASGDLLITFDKARTKNYWTDNYSISLENGNKTIRVSNLNVTAGGSAGPIQIQLEPLGAKITSVSFAGKKIAVSSNSGSSGINPNLDLEYNFAKALQYSLYMYDANMCGSDVEGNSAFTWRKNCHPEDATQMKTSSGKVVDVSGGYHDAGDHVKFNLPQAFSSTTLGLSYYEFKDAFDELGQSGHMKLIMDRFVEYFENCTVLDSSGNVETYCYQVGEGGADHSYWGVPENQPSRAGQVYFTSSSVPCTDIVGETAATLAIYAVNYKDEDSAAAAKALKYAKALFKYADQSSNKAHSGSAPGASFYPADIYHDDMALASIWLYKATGDEAYKTKYNEYVQGCKTGWTYCWNDVSAAAYLYGEQYSNVKSIMDSKMNKVSPQGFAYVDDGNWGTARYNAALQFIGLSMDQHTSTSAYRNWALGQMSYLMGNNTSRRNYIVGFNENSPKYFHHRGASGYSDVNSNATTKMAHVIYGALVGGPDSGDYYDDNASNYQYAEITIDYNAGFVGAAAGLYLQAKADDNYKDDQYIVTSKDGLMKEVSIYYGEETVDPNASPRPTKTPRPTKKPGSTDDPGNTNNPNNPENTSKPDNPDNPGNTNNPNNPDNPENTNNPDNPGNTDNPDNPDNPENTGNPNNPVSSDAPGNTDNPGGGNQNPDVGPHSSATPVPSSTSDPQNSAAPGSGNTTVITNPNQAIQNEWSGADYAMTEQQIVSQKSDKDIAGSVYGILKLRSAKTTKNSVKLKWGKASGATGYVVYGNRCGNGNALQKLATVKGSSWTHKKLKKGTYYKYLVVAYQTVSGKDVALGISKTVHAATLGGKKGNAKKITVKKAKVSLKKGKTFKIKAKQIPVKKKTKIAKHRKISYESSDKSIATVTSSGKIKGIKKGKCSIFVYAQNGVYKQVKVTVK